MCAGAGADPNAVDVYGRSPLHYSAHTNCPAAFALVAEAGGQIDHPDVEGPYVFFKSNTSTCSVLHRSFPTNKTQNQAFADGMSALPRHRHLLMRIPLTPVF
jgi:ankyrin repeat protein